MTRTYEGKTSASIYRNQLQDLVYNPDYVVDVRGRPTREILNVVTEIKDPRARCQIVPGRRLSPWLALSESLWLLAGRNDAKSLKPYNKRILEFSDNGTEMYGAYGFRMTEQIPYVIERLQNEASDRRAVIQIWGAEDLVAETKDPPCNTQVMFKVREGDLYMSVTNRSNDLHWGLHAVNIFQFGMLQEYIACRLGVGMGTQTHFSNSLHIYTDERGNAITRRMIAEWDEPIEELPSEDWLFPNPFPDAVSHATFRVLCGATLDDRIATVGEFPFLEFAGDFLSRYRKKSKEVPRHHQQYFSWMEMGYEYL